MREIPLANGRGVAFVDDEDYELVSQYTWAASTKGNQTYAVHRYDGDGKRRSLRMHRLLMPDVALIDHRDAAEAGLRVVSDPALWGAHHDLTGPAPMSWPEAIELLSAELGEPVTFRVVSERTYLTREAIDNTMPFRVVSQRADAAPRGQVGKCGTRFGRGLRENADWCSGADLLDPGVNPFAFRRCRLQADGI